MAELLYIVDPLSKQLTPVNPVSFADIGVKERQDLEAWVTSHPAVFGQTRSTTVWCGTGAG